MTRVRVFLRIFLFVSLAGACLSVSSCGAVGGDEQKAKTPAAPALFPVTANPLADEAARFLAGMPGKADSVLKPLEAEKQWQAHAAAFDGAFTRWATGRQPLIAGFRKTELAGAEIEGATAFYPFGGPDVVHLLTFYPRNPAYIMVGLEPPGTLPTLKTLQSDKLESQLPSVRRTLSDVLGRSFFITRQMDQQLRGQVTDGLLPIMLVQLVRSGAKIVGTAPVTLDDRGGVIARDEAAKDVANRGVVIDFQLEGETGTRRIYYFSINLGDKKFVENKSFHAFLGLQPKMVSMFKSTSYMPHRDDFSAIRQQVLERSIAVVQDDSGIPFRFYEPSRWTTNLYGDYTEPYGSFRYLVQRDLQRAFADKSTVKALPFNIGYGFNRAPSNLLIARRKQ